MSRYQHWALTYTGLFLAFQVAGCMKGPTIPAGAQLSIVLSMLCVPMVIKGLINRTFKKAYFF